MSDDDTHDDPHAFLRDDDYLGPLVEAYGELPVEAAEDFFERFVTSVLRQQVSTASAAATRERLHDAVEVTPEGIRDADPETLKGAGLSRQKTEYVRNIADAFVEDGLSAEYFEGMAEEDVRAELTDITGVGDWTANLQLMFALGREDVFPVGDLGIRKGMRELLDDPDMTRAEMREFAERWAPYRTYASRYVWQFKREEVE